jgi:hypothetical protein
MYIRTGEGLGQALMLSGSLAGTLAASPLTPELQEFLNQVRKRPQNVKKLLLTVTLHPKPEDSVIWDKQTFTFGKQTKYLVDEALISELPTAFILTVLKRISDANFSQQIKDESHLQIQMINATGSLGKALLQPFLFDPLLLPVSGGGLPYKELSRLARHFAQSMLPKDLAQRIMNSEASEAHLAYLGSFLRSYAEQLQKKDPHFKRQVEIARKWQLEQEQRRKQRGTKKAP